LLGIFNENHYRVVDNIELGALILNAVIGVKIHLNIEIPIELPFGRNDDSVLELSIFNFPD